MRYWGYIEREEYIILFEKEFPVCVCPGADEFFSVSEQDIIRQIIEDKVPFGDIEITYDSLYAICDEHEVVSSKGMIWLLPAICRYILHRKPHHGYFVELIPLYIELGYSDYCFNLSLLTTNQKELLYNYLEYCAETYGIKVSIAQDKLTMM